MSKYFKEKDEKNMRIVDECCTTLPLACTEYFNDVALGRETSTMANYARQLNVFFNWVHEELLTGKDPQHYDFSDLSRITSDDVTTFMYELRHKGDSDETLLAYLRAISSFYKHFNKKGKLRTNPVDGVTRPKHKKAPKVYLDAVDLPRFESTVKNGQGLSERVQKYRDTINSTNRDNAIVAVLYDTGIRVSELVGIDLTDIDFSRCRISVRRKGGDITLTYFSNETADFLNAYLDDRAKFVDKKEQALFVSFVGKNKGHRLSVRSIEIMIKKYAVAAGVSNADKMTPHKLRHTCGMALLKATGNIALVQAQLAHKSITSTTVYAQADDSDLENIRNLRRNCNES